MTEAVWFEITLSESVSQLQRSIFRDYAGSVGLDSDARYLDGTPLRPVVPLDVAVGGVMVIGAYPSARFAVIGKERDVPVADNLGPFENERWFDGARVREQPSARELQDLFLGPLGVSRADCWITDLVKVFLFKSGHRKKYERLGAESPPGYERERFPELANRSLPWIAREIGAAKPRVIITLGAEVAGQLRGETAARSQVALLKPEIGYVTVAGADVPIIHCAHPGILMRATATNRWRESIPQYVEAIRIHLGTSNP